MGVHGCHFLSLNRSVLWLYQQSSYWWLNSKRIVIWGHQKNHIWNLHEMPWIIWERRSLIERQAKWKNPMVSKIYTYSCTHVPQINYSKTRGRIRNYHAMQYYLFTQIDANYVWKIGKTFRDEKFPWITCIRHIQNCLLQHRDHFQSPEQ